MGWQWERFNLHAEVEVSFALHFSSCLSIDFAFLSYTFVPEVGYVVGITKLGARVGEQVAKNTKLK